MKLECVCEGLYSYPSEWSWHIHFNTNVHYTLCPTLCPELPPTLQDRSLKVAVPLTLQKTAAALLLLQKNYSIYLSPSEMSTGTKSSARFQCLNDTNYAEWSLHMEVILVCGGLWGMIHPEIDQQKADGIEKDALTITLELEVALKARTMMKMNEAWAEIILCLEDGQLSHCLQTNDPCAIWLILESAHSDVTLYLILWYKEHKQCIIWYGFREFLEPVNDIGSEHWY